MRVVKTLWISYTRGGNSAMYGYGYNSCGCNLKLSEVPFGVDFGPFGPQAGPKSTPNDPDRTSDNLKWQPHEL